jgi:hypothetical protein
MSRERNKEDMKEDMGSHASVFNRDINQDFFLIRRHWFCADPGSFYFEQQVRIRERNTVPY